MNIRVELLKLQENASLLDRAEFAAKFMTIAEEYNRLQLLQQTPCTTLLPLARLYSFAETLAKGDHEWRYSDEDKLWHKDGWVSRSTDELMQLFPERL